MARCANADATPREWAMLRWLFEWSRWGVARPCSYCGAQPGRVYELYVTADGIECQCCGFREG